MSNTKPTSPSDAESAPKPSPATRHTADDATNVLVMRWWIASILGLAIAVLLAERGPLDDMPLAVSAMFAVVSGWVIILVFGPRQRLADLRTSHARLLAIMQVLEDFRSGRRDHRLRILLDQPKDVIGDLARALHDTLEQVIASRSEARMLQRTMEDAVRRQTRKATMQLLREVETDALTGLGNRRALARFIDETEQQSDAECWPLTVMAIDLDRFKQINDTLGHAKGDECLTFLANLLRSSLRKNDCIVRLGGDEFVILMPGLTEVDAMPVARRLAALFTQMPWSHQKPARPTLSIGLASAESGEVESIEQLIRRADESLYASKRGGRSAVTAYGELRQVA